jgi:hypothetical protein
MSELARRVGHALTRELVSEPEPPPAGTDR